MFKFIKKIKELEKRVYLIEEKFNEPVNQASNSPSPSYKEVIDEWLNGKRS